MAAFRGRSAKGSTFPIPPIGTRGGVVPADEATSSFQLNASLPPVPSTLQRGPQHFDPAGKRYTIAGASISWLKWEFAFNVRSTSSLGLFDVRYGGERIAYEVSVQEAGAFYSGARTSSMQQQTAYLDSAWSMGNLGLELIVGVDCPIHASMLNTTRFVMGGKIEVLKNSICVFELDTGTPVRRHTEFVTGYPAYSDWAGGLQGTVLVVRTITTGAQDWAPRLGDVKSSRHNPSL